jgi:hypothetical protein
MRMLEYYLQIGHCHCIKNAYLICNCEAYYSSPSSIELCIYLHTLYKPLALCLGAGISFPLFYFFTAAISASKLSLILITFAIETVSLKKLRIKILSLPYKWLFS